VAPVVGGDEGGKCCHAVIVGISAPVIVSPSWVLRLPHPP